MKLPLRFYMSALIGLAVVCISATVIAIVSTLYSNAATDLGVRYGKQLGDAGANRVEDYLIEQYYGLVGLATSLVQSFNGSFPLPKTDPNGGSLTAADYCTPVRTVLRLSNGGFNDAGIIFDDGASMFLVTPENIPSNGTAVFRCALANGFNSSVTGNTQVTQLAFDVETNQEYNDPAIFQPVFGSYPQGPASAVPSIYPSGRAVAILQPTVFWPPPLLVRSTQSSIPRLVFPATMPIRDELGDYKGIMALNVNIDTLKTFIIDLDLTENSHAFIVYSNSEIILATTHSAPTAVVTNTTSTFAPNGCLNSYETVPAAVNSLYCPILPKDFDFAPIRQLYQQNDKVFSHPENFEREIEADGDVYYVTNFKLSNPGALFAVSATFFVYFNDVQAQITDARNIVIGVGIGILVISVAICVVLLAVLLSPLEVVALQMKATSQLKLAAAKKIGLKSSDKSKSDLRRRINNKNDGKGLSADALHQHNESFKENNDNNDKVEGNQTIPHSAAVISTSNILEIFFLQNAYANMHNAVDAFTRYTNKTVVKNLLASGRLAANRKSNNSNASSSSPSSIPRNLSSMSNTHATILASDIQGFTSICERTADPRELSDVLGIFFEEMSSIIMNHEGVIIQYIGDAIIAAWGALCPCDFQQVKACVAALMMTRETCMPTLTTAFESIGESLAVRIGVHCGPVLCGILGSHDRVAYSVFGPSADLASNLEAWNKKFNTRILISEAVAKEVEKFMLVRCVYSSRKIPVDKTDQFHSQSGLFVVSPENAKEFWRENGPAILRRSASGAGVINANMSSTTPAAASTQQHFRNSSNTNQNESSKKMQRGDSYGSGPSYTNQNLMMMMRSSNTQTPSKSFQQQHWNNNKNNNNNSHNNDDHLGSANRMINSVGEGNDELNDHDNNELGERVDSADCTPPNSYFGHNINNNNNNSQKTTSNSALGGIQMSAQEREKSYLLRKQNSDEEDSNHNNTNPTDPHQIAHQGNNANTNGAEEDDENMNHLLCYELVGLLPKDRVEFTQLETIPQAVSRNVTLNQSTSTPPIIIPVNDNNKNNNTSFGAKNNTNNTNRMHFSFASDSEYDGSSGTDQDDLDDDDDDDESDDILTVSANLESGGSSQQQQQQDNISRSGGQLSISVGDFGSNQHHHHLSDNAQLQKLKRSPKRIAKLKERRRQMRGNKRRNIAQVFHDAADQSQEASSIIVSEAEIEFSTNFTMTMLSRYPSQTRSNTAFDELVERYPVFFQRSGAGDHDDERQRLNDLLCVVGIHRCRACLINAKTRQVQEVLQ